MRTIPLTKGTVAIVDNNLFDKLSAHKWYCSKIGYAVRNVKVASNKQATLYMHKLIVKTDKEVDHKNGNKLDNRRRNLRICRGPGNQRNVPMRRNNTSGFKGVFWHSQRTKWRAQINVGNKFLYLGLFDNRKDAARAYNVAAKKHHGRFARLNKII